METNEDINPSEDDINFIKTELLPELVHERCFCETGSREFVEYDSASVKYLKTKNGSKNQESYYLANIIVKFSGDSKNFPLFIKLLPISSNEIAYDRLLNEEIFFNSHLVRKNDMKLLPKCYAVSMGKYGQPFIVFENLKVQGFEKINKKLNLEEIKLCINAIGFFHGTILKFVKEKNSSLNNFTTLKNLEFDDTKYDNFQKGYLRIMNLVDSSLAKKIMEKLGENPFEKLKKMGNKEQIICHGHLSNKNLFFKYINGKAIDVKIVDWHQIKYSSFGMDLASIILDNIPEDIKSIEEILTCYLEAVKSGYPEKEKNFLSMTEVRSTFVSNLLYAYFTLSLEEDCSNERIMELSEQLERLGAFNGNQ